MTSAQAKEFLDAITENSPEEDSYLWFENAPPLVRLVAFIKLEQELRRLKEERA